VGRHGRIPALSYEEAVALDSINDTIGGANCHQALAALDSVVAQATQGANSPGRFLPSDTWV
jgi:hypothetical protein